MDNEHKILNYRGLDYFLSKLKNLFIIDPKQGKEEGKVLALDAANKPFWKRITESVFTKENVQAGYGINAVSDIENVYISNKNVINKIHDYLYTLNIKAEEQDYSEELQYFFDTYYEPNDEDPMGACSSYTTSKFHARNYDWYYDEKPTFVVRTRGGITKDGRRIYSSLGVAAGQKSYTELQLFNDPDTYKHVPFLLLDGVNEKGLSCSINCISPEPDLVTRTDINTHTGEDRVCLTMIVKYILDNCATVNEAQTLLESINLYSPYKNNEYEEIHISVREADGEGKIFEWYNNVLSSNAPSFILTNFYVTKASYDSTWKVVTGIDSDLYINNPHAWGIERYNIIRSKINVFQLNNAEDALNVFTNDLKYTNTYTNTENIWYSEFNGIYPEGELTVASIPRDYTTALTYARNAYSNRERGDGNTWQTVHTSVYDFNSNKLVIKIQEGDVDLELNKYFYFNFDDCCCNYTGKNGVIVNNTTKEIKGSYSAGVGINIYNDNTDYIHIELIQDTLRFYNNNTELFSYPKSNYGNILKFVAGNGIDIISSQSSDNTYSLIIGQTEDQLITLQSPYIISHSNKYYKISTSNNITLQVESNITQNKECIVRIDNTGATEIAITLPSDNHVYNMYGATTLQIPANKKGEVCCTYYLDGNVTINGGISL